MECMLFNRDQKLLMTLQEASLQTLNKITTQVMISRESVFEDTMEAVQRVVFSPDKAIHVSKL